MCLIVLISKKNQVCQETLGLLVITFTYFVFICMVPPASVVNNTSQGFFI